MTEKEEQNKEGKLYGMLETINSRPEPFACYTAQELWTDVYIAEKMLQHHLDGQSDVCSRREPVIDATVEWLSGRFGIDRGCRIADFGCGPGLYAQRLARKGAQVTGIDFSANTIRHAEKAAAGEGLRIDYVLGDYLQWETEEKFDLILMIMCDFSVLSPAQRSLLLHKFHRLLRPGGSVLLDVYSLEAFRKRQEASGYEKNLMNGFWSADDYFGFYNTFKYEREKVVLDKYTILEPGRTRTVYNWFQFFTPEDLGHEFEAHGFGVPDLLGDVAGNPYEPEGDEFAVVAECR